MLIVAGQTGDWDHCDFRGVVFSNVGTRRSPIIETKDQGLRDLPSSIYFGFVKLHLLCASNAA